MKNSLAAGFRASASASQSLAQLGPLAELPGNWIGRGFNLIAVPDKQGGKPFRLMLNTTQERLSFTPIGGPIPNRGSAQGDIFFLGLHYLQQVSDGVTGGGLHLEPGLWLNLPATTAPAAAASVARLGTVPHGDALLAQGSSLAPKGPPKFDAVDSTPFTLDAKSGAWVNVTDATYLAPFTATPLPQGLPAGTVANPNLVLRAAIQGQEITDTVVLKVNANAIGGIGGAPLAPGAPNGSAGGINNIPFVVSNANVVSLTATFWIETVLLDFLDLKWPHVSVATLIKQ